MMEHETGKVLKYLWTDNRGEYMSNAFEDYCLDYDIRYEKTVHGTLQHNSVAERMNRTIVKKVKNILRMTGLLKSFWSETVLLRTI